MRTRSNGAVVRAFFSYVGLWLAIGLLVSGCTVTGNSNNVHASSTVFRW